MAKTSSTTDRAAGPKLSDLIGADPPTKGSLPDLGEEAPSDADFYTKPTETSQADRDATAWEDIKKKRADRTTRPVGRPEVSPTKETPPGKAEGERAQEPEPEGDEEPAEVTKAKALLRRKGYDPEYVDELPAEKALALKAKISKREADIDAAFEERAKLAKRVAELETGAPPASGPAKSQVPPEVKKAELREELTALEGELGKDANAALQRIIDTRVREALASVEPVIAEIKERDEQMRGQQIEETMREIRDGLGERFPDLQDESEFKRVFAYMDHMATLPKYGQTMKEEGREVALFELMIDAARMVGLEEVDDKADEDESEDAAKAKGSRQERAASRPRADERRAKPVQLKGTAADWVAFKALNQNRDNPRRVDLARRAAGYG